MGFPEPSHGLANCRAWPRSTRRCTGWWGPLRPEHVIGGLVFTDAETVTVLDRLFDTFVQSATALPRVWQSSGGRQK